MRPDGGPEDFYLNSGRRDLYTNTGAFRQSRGRADIVVLTLGEEETQAVTAALQRLPRHRQVRLVSGTLAHEATLHSDNGPMRIAAAQTPVSGPATKGSGHVGRSSEQLPDPAGTPRHTTMIEAYQPSTVLLVGIGGGLADQVRIGDVVISDESRPDTPRGTRRHGQPIPSALGHRLDSFLAHQGNDVPSPYGVPFRLHRGLISTEITEIINAATETAPETRTSQATVHDPVTGTALAVETTLAELVQAIHRRTAPLDCLAVLGIANRANTRRPAAGDFRALAAANTATAILTLIPHLRRFG
ncbi:phosphorylase family protein [Actinoplanes subglobosus]|uniref:Nucleoside phosphorylase domain-containing protein n=1 Tax=Actinoplanes subglobosus TaxID=1547892 RepID=A0ABV8J0J1_9ACTN